MGENQSTTPWYKAAMDWLSLNLGTKLLDAVMTYGGNYLASSVSGFYGWILKLAFKYVVIPFIKHAKNYIKHVHEGKEELAKLNEVLNDPSKTNEEIIKAHEDFLTRP